VHLIHHHVLISKKAADAVKVNRDALVAVAIILDPVHIAVQRVKAENTPALTLCFQVRAAAALIFELQFVDAESQKVGHVRGSWIA